MDIGIYRGILKVTVVSFGAIHLGNLISPGKVMWGFALSLGIRVCSVPSTLGGIFRFHRRGPKKEI